MTQAKPIAAYPGGYAVTVPRPPRRPRATVGTGQAAGSAGSQEPLTDPTTATGPVRREARLRPTAGASRAELASADQHSTRTAAP